MKSRILFFTLFAAAFLFSGCYTQLEYSHRMHRITDERPNKWDDNEKRAEDTATETDSNYGEGYEDGYRNAADYYYRDYATARWYAHHGFGNYYFSHDPFYDWYYPYGNYLSLSFHFGYPAGLRYLHYTDPFAYHWYSSHWRFARPYGFYPGYYYSYYYWPQYNFYPSYYFFQTGYAGFVGPRKKSDRKYGRRTIGTGRTITNSVSTDNNGRIRTGTGIRTSAGGDRTTVIRSRGNSDTGRTRNRNVRSDSDSRRATGRSGTLRRPDREERARTTRIDRNNTDKNNSSGITIERRRFINNRAYYNESTNTEILNRLRNYRAPEIDRDQINRSRFDSRNRFPFNFFDTRSQRNSVYTPRTRSTINRSSSGSTTRTRVRSSSSSSRSSSRGRSSSSSGGSSSKKRSRGGN